MAQHQREPSVDEIAKILELKREDVVFALDAILEPVSLYEPVYSDSGDTICVMDQVKDNKNNDEMWVERIALKEAVGHLTERERKILLCGGTGSFAFLPCGEKILPCHHAGVWQGRGTAGRTPPGIAEGQRFPYH